MLKKISLVLITAFFGLGGINHFLNPAFYLNLMPPYFPMPELLNYASGAVEILVAILFWIPAYRKIASYTTIAMLISFFTVHIYHLQIGGVLPDGTVFLSMWGLWFRIAMQFVFILWAWWHRK